MNVNNQGHDTHHSQNVRREGKQSRNEGPISMHKEVPRRVKPMAVWPAVEKGRRSLQRFLLWKQLAAMDDLAGRMAAPAPHLLSQAHQPRAQENPSSGHLLLKKIFMSHLFGLHRWESEATCRHVASPPKHSGDNLTPRARLQGLHLG